MRKIIKILFVIILVPLFMGGCGSGSTGNALSSEDEKIATNMLESKREVVIKKEKSLAKEKLKSEIKATQVNNEEEKPTPQKEEKKEEKDKTASKEKVPAYTPEKMSGDFMATESLNMRKGPGTDFQSVGSLTAYAKAVATEKATLNGDTWYKITSNSVTGWSSANYLVAYKKAETPTKKPTETAAKQPAKKPTEKPVEKPVEKPKPKPSTSVSPSATEKAVIDLTNAKRKDAGLEPLKVDNNAVASARAKSNDMATHKYFGHTSPTYGSAGSQLSQFGVSWNAWGENIAQGQSSAEQVVTSWMNSPGHKKNILSKSMTHIGVGYDSNGNYWTQQFISK